MRRIYRYGLNLEDTKNDIYPVTMMLEYNLKVLGYAVWFVNKIVCFNACMKIHGIAQGL